MCTVTLFENHNEDAGGAAVALSNDGVSSGNGWGGGDCVCANPSGYAEVRGFGQTLWLAAGQRSEVSFIFTGATGGEPPAGFEPPPDGDEVWDRLEYVPNGCNGNLDYAF